MTKVSVLMPIYNASRYLQNALDSVRNQSLKDIEIICINDGSTDNSLKIINQNTQNDKRIKIINKPNSGYGDSLNTGLKEATGSYISILEPDDWYDLNFLKDMYHRTQKDNLDVIKADFWQYIEANNINRQYHLFTDRQCDKVLSPTESQFIYSLQPSIWSGLYRRQFLIDNHIKFLKTPGASYQDTSFNFKVFAIAKKALFINKPYVHYRIDNTESSINNIAKKLPFIDTEYDEIDHFIKYYNLSLDFQTQSDYCRFLTYVWATEQLQGAKLCQYLQKISPCAKKISASPTADLFNIRQLAVLHQIADHPRLYAIRRTASKLKKTVLFNH